MAATILSQVQAQDTAVATLRRALTHDRVHHAYLFDGPDGVGKEKAAFGLAQALVCEERGISSPKDEACGVCSSCRRVPLRAGDRRPAHPDVAVLERGLYDPAQIGRRTPETQDISIDQVRTLVLARAAFPPHEGRAKVFVVRRAEELSIAAANALLKTLEEPGKGTHFLLLSAAPDTLLPTIRSRTQRLRFGLLPDAVIEALLVARGVEAPRAKAVAALSGGTMAQADVLSDPELAGAREAFVGRALSALKSPDMTAALELAEEAKKIKGELDTLLKALGLALAEEVKALVREGDDRERHAVAVANRYRDVLVALRHLDGNASAQLAIESMFSRMRAV